LIAVKPTWVAFEGGEGCGKSTQAEMLAAHLGAQLTREPGGTLLGRSLRSLLLAPDMAIDNRAEALLLAADRAQHVAEVVAPLLQQGRSVVSDRSAFSFLAYQGYGRGLALDDLRQLTDWASYGQWPDRVFLLDVDPTTADARLAQRGGGGKDRLESETVTFHERVREGFRALAAADPSRWRVIDGRGTVEDVGRAVRSAWESWIDE
jgi:dTMP kinase